MNKDEILKAAAFAGGGIVLGAAGGYLITNHQLKKHYQAILDAEVDAVIQQYKILRKEGEYETPESTINVVGFPVRVREEADLVFEEGEAEMLSEAAEAFAATVNAKNAMEEYDSPAVAVPEEHNIFADRDKNNPYVVSYGEYIEDDEDYDNVTVTYYEGDDTLADDQEKIIPDIEGTIGRNNLGSFGLQSEDDDVVYIRNERLKVQFEVVKDEREYAQAVMGVPWDSLNVKEPKPRPKKVRDDE